MLLKIYAMLIYISGRISMWVLWLKNFHIATCVFVHPTIPVRIPIAIYACLIACMRTVFFSAALIEPFAIFIIAISANLRPRTP